MPLPWLLLGAGALIGGAAHLNAEEKNDRAKFIADSAKSEYEENQSSYTWAESNAKTSLQEFGSKKQAVLGTSIKQFVSAYEKVKHIQFNETIGIEELKNYQITIEGFNGLVQWTDIYESKFSSAAAGAATGALTTLALGGDIAAIGSALSVGGAALAAGEIGVAGAAFGAAITPLAALAVPAVLFSGISANIKADENLKKAEEYASKVNVAIEKMRTATVKYNAIKERTDILNNLLGELDLRFAYCASMMDAVIMKRAKKNKGKPLSKDNFTENELKLIAITRALAGAIKSILDTPLLSSKGDLTQESANNISRLNTALPKLKEQAQAVQNTDYGVKPKKMKVSRSDKKNKEKAVSGSGTPSIVRDVIGCIVGAVVAFILPFNLWGRLFVFSILAMFIGSNEPANKLIKNYHGLLISTMWISSFALFMLGAVSLVNMSHYIIATIIIGIIAFIFLGLTADSMEEEDLNVTKIIFMISIAIVLFCIALLIFAFLYKALEFINVSKILIGIVYGFIIFFIILMNIEEYDLGKLESVILFGTFVIAIGLIVASVRGNEYDSLFGTSHYHKLAYNSHSPKYLTSDNIENFNNNTIEDNYREIINACNQEDTENNFTYREYYITDINNDGIPELIIHIGRNIKDAEYIIYTYKDNNSYECGVSGGILNIEDENEEKLERLSRESQEIVTKGDNCIYISFCYAGYQHTSEIKLKDNLLLDISDYYDSGSEKLSDYNIPGDVIVNSDFSDTDLLVSALDINTQMIEKPRTLITTKSVTTKESTTTTTTVTTTQTSKVESDIKTYNITFEASELIEKAGLKLGGHVGIAVLSNLTCSNGNANIETNTIYNYDSLVKVEVTGATAGEVVLGGTITTYGLDMVQGESVSYPDSSGVFLISKTVGEISEDKPYAEAYIEASRLTQGDGYEYNLYVSGYFSYVEVSYYANSREEEINYTSGSSSPIFLTAGSSFGSVTAYVTPYNSDGIAGETVSCTGYASGTVQTDCFSYSVDNVKGQINCHGEIVAGFTTDYVVNGGAVGKVRNSLGDKWHVTAKNACTNYGITWYELWDSDDGDYYGWVDEKYIDFNGGDSSSNETVISSVNNKTGQINCHGGIVAGYTTDYICNGGSISTVRKSLGDKWHITAKNSCYNHDVLWYELWDTDDGDYYGWVDSNYIDFY